MGDSSRGMPAGYLSARDSGREAGEREPNEDARKARFILAGFAVSDFRVLLVCPMPDHAIRGLHGVFGWVYAAGPICACISRGV
jgi:hypothetical protein